MTDRFTSTIAHAAIYSLFVTALTGCSDQTPTQPIQAEAVAPVPTARTAIVDVIERLLPDLQAAAEAAALSGVFNELAAALERPTGRDVTAAISTARAAVERYAGAVGADPAEVDAMRLAIQAAETEITENSRRIQP